MNKFLLGAVGFLAMATSASAADLAARPYTKAPPMVAAMYDWSGFYIGGNGGWGSSRKCWDLHTAAGVFVTSEGCHDATGGVAGGQIGYRWQSSAWVFGVEAQGDWADLRGSNASIFPPFIAVGLTNRSRVEAFGLFTGQVGYAWSNALLYVKGGAAVTSDRYQGLIAGTVIDSAKEARWGGVAGIGLEYGFAPNWSVAVEYDHLFMGSRHQILTSALAPPPVGTFSRDENIRQDVDLVTVRLNYRWGGPVVAKY